MLNIGGFQFDEDAPTDRQPDFVSRRDARRRVTVFTTIDARPR
jgi:hypothetical protein